MLKKALLRLGRFLKLFSLDENLLRYINGGDVLPSPYTAEKPFSPFFPAATISSE